MNLNATLKAFCFMKQSAFILRKKSFCLSFLRISIIALLLLYNSKFIAQTTIYSENFETATGAQNYTGPYLGWQSGQFTAQTNDNYWWVFNNTRCNVIAGNYSMAVSQNTPATTGTLPQYRMNKRASTLVYLTTPINATNYTSITLDFKWRCMGETNADYGSVLYSFDGNNWATLPGTYLGQNNVQTVTNLNLSAVNGQPFYLGFGWVNDNNGGANPGFVVDDIVVKGTLLTPCTEPNQPTNLVLTSTDTSISGSFNPAVPAPSNYLVVRNTTGINPVPVDGTTYAIGGTIGAGNIVVDTDNDTTFTATGLNPSTLYYFYIFSFNNTACINGPNYNSVNPLKGNRTTTSVTYCTPLTSNTTSIKYINDVEFIGTLNDVTNLNNSFSTSPAGYQNFTNRPKSVQAQGEGVNVYVGSSTGRGHYKAWVDWNKNGVFDNPGELVYDTGGVATTTATFGFIIPTNQTIGDYRIRIRFFNSYRNGGAEYYAYNFNPCETFASVSPGGPSYVAYGEAEDYLFTVVQSCSAKITSITNGSSCGEGTVNLQVAGSAGVTQYKWYNAETGGNLVATTNTGTWTPFLNATTTFWVTASNGSCESLKRVKIIATINPITDLTIIGSTTICGENNILEISATGGNEVAYLINEDFESGGLGSFSNTNITTNQNAITMWQNKTSTFVPQQQVWFPAISSGFGTNKFVMATSDVPTSNITHNALVSSVLNSTNFVNLTLNFDMYFSRYVFTPSIPENVNVDISTNGGTNWTTIQTYDNDIGYGTKFTNLTVDLSTYINQANLRVRIRYYANYWCDGVAVDNIKLYGDKPLTPSFTWTGSVNAYTDAAAVSSPYVPGTPASIVYIRPTLAQLELSTYTFTANATLSNGCTVSKDVTITNNSKVWRGDQNASQEWDNANNWKPNGVPTVDNCVIIPSVVKLPNDGIPIPPVLYNAYAKNITIKNTGNLEILSGNNLTVTEWIHNEGTNNFDIRNGASLIQIDDVPNSGSVKIDRTASVKKTDYVYYSSPVDGYSMSNLSPLTPSAVKFRWLPTTVAGGGFVYGNWAIAGSDIMGLGRGYIVRGPSTFLTAQPLTATFDGTPRNGNITVTISRGSYTGPNTTYLGRTVTKDDDNYNLIGNPYPSAISANAFLSDGQNTNILGSIYLWPHGGVLSAANSNPFYQDFVYNYNSADYITYNSMGSVPPNTFNGYVAAGQSFFVLMTDANSNSENLYFKNGMRVSNNNDQFLRTDSEALELNRIYLDLVLPDGKTSSTLVGYTPEATYEIDRLYDSPTFDSSSQNLYSKIGEESMIIQGRPLPFDDTDRVSLGLLIPQQGIYTIAINSLDGLFANADQNIYLEDLDTGIVHNLKNAPYMFNANAGRYDNRFILRYNNDTTLGTPEILVNSELNIIKFNTTIKVTSGNSSIESITIYDVLGRSIMEFKNVNANDFRIPLDKLNQGTFIVKATLQNGLQKTKKVIY